MKKLTPPKKKTTKKEGGCCFVFAKYFCTEVLGMVQLGALIRPCGLPWSLCWRKRKGKTFKSISVSLLEEKERKGFQRHLCLSFERKGKERHSKPPVALSERKGKERLPSAPPSLLKEKKRKGFRNNPCLSFERKGKTRGSRAAR